MERRTFLKAMSGMAGLTLARSVPAMPMLQQQARKIAVVGLGGAGGRIVSRLADENPGWWHGSNLYVEHYAIDTDYRALGNVSGNVRQILLPAERPVIIRRRDADTEHERKHNEEIVVIQGAGGTDTEFERRYGGGGSVFPVLARKAAWRHRDLMADVWDGRGLPDDPIVFLVAGFGRGAGTGLAQMMSWQAYHHKIFACIPMLAMPLSWEVRPTISLYEEMHRLECVSESGLCLFEHDESNLDEDQPMAAILEKMDKQIIQDIIGAVTS